MSKKPKPKAKPDTKTNAARDTVTDTDQVGPLGRGRELENDPLKGIRGVMAGTHILESIVVLLVLTVITRVNPEVNATLPKMIYVIALGVAMFIAAFMQKMRSARTLNIALQVLAVAGVFVHLSMGFVGLLFAATWWYIYHLKGNLEERMRRGLLPAQHVS